MFEIGFWELVLIGAIALVVFGPDKLPQFARRAGYWIGRVRRQVNDVRNEIEREIAMDELRRQRDKLAAPLHDLANDIRRVGDIESEMKIPAADSKTETPAPPT
jgi:sec-independent protein translocase protein TatB